MSVEQVTSQEPEETVIKDEIIEEAAHPFEKSLEGNEEIVQLNSSSADTMLDNNIKDSSLKNFDVNSSGHQKKGRIRTKPIKNTKISPKRQKKQKSNTRQTKRKKIQKKNEDFEKETSEVNGSEEDSEAQEQKLFSCKLCDKVFRSSFILCLHLQIHKKVGSVPNNTPSSKQGTSKSEIIKNKITPKKTNESEPPPIFNKNFVENLKKNLSLAMNRKL